MAQQGANPRYPLPCGVEYDLFAETHARSIYKLPDGTPSAARMSVSPPLSRLAVLSFRFGLNVVQELDAKRCKVNYAGYLVAITLQATSGRSMFYQVFLRDTRGLSFRNAVCGGYPQGRTYCFSVSASVIAANPPKQPLKSHTDYDINVLPFLTTAVAATADPNLSHWSVSSVYFGQLMQGGMTCVSRWDSFVLSAY